MNCARIAVCPLISAKKGKGGGHILSPHSAQAHLTRLQSETKFASLSPSPFSKDQMVSGRGRRHGAPHVTASVGRTRRQQQEKDGRARHSADQPSQAKPSQANPDARLVFLSGNPHPTVSGCVCSQTKRLPLCTARSFIIPVYEPSQTEHNSD